MQRLENIYKQLGGFLSELLNSLFSVIKILLKSRRQKAVFSPSATGVILGNGPSLALSLEKHFDFLSQHTSICVNSFALTKEFETLKPAFYVMHDPGLWLSDHDLPRNIFKAINEKATWPLTIWIPASSRNSPHLKFLSQNKFVNISFYNYTIFKGFRFLAHWFYRKNLAMPQCQNVLVASLFLCINAGFKELYIFGADHTWHENIAVDKSNVLCVKDVHYYDEEETVVLRPFKKGLHLNETFRVYEIFEAWAKVFKGYFMIECYAKSRNVKIYNSSEVSFIDAFERREIS